ncbi:MAG: helix-turn-helix domain-containing protein [Mangrovibacterium sp.]
MTKEDLKRAIGKKVVELRSERGWSQADLARACEKDRQAIEKIENGKVNPTVFSICELAEAMHIPPKTLLDFYVD